jgi:aminoglycoside 6'-N-acetyltransferase I
VWELHPLAVQPNVQGKGVGRALVEDFEEQVRLMGGLTITLGSDDEDNMTSLSGVDLYENLWEKVQDIRNLKNHPFEFYQKMGYIVTGVVIDANGSANDILMSKKVGNKRWSSRARKALSPPIEVNVSRSPLDRACFGIII